MLKLLIRRAKALRQVKFEKVQRIEAKMDSLKESHFELLRTPNSFYCTFEKTKAVQTMTRLKKVSFNGHRISVKRAKDPSDIHWLNKGVKRTSRMARFGIFLTLAVLVNIISVYG